MATLASLVVDLRTNTAKFSQGMDKANRKLDSLTKAATTARRVVWGLFGAAAAMGLKNLITGAIDAADGLDKMSVRIGASTEALSEYQHVAELSGVAFNTLTMAWQRMTRRIAEAARGTGEARGALQELGLSAQKLKELKPEQQFEILADALMGVGSEADRVRLAMKLFDSEGVSVLQTMGRGSQGLREMRDEAQRLGIAMGQDQVQAMVKAKDSMARFTASVSGAVNSIVANMSPTLKDLADFMTNWIGPSFNFAATTVRNFGKLIGGVAAALVQLAQGEFSLSAKVIKDAFKDLENPLDAFTRRIEITATKTQRGAVAMRDFAMETAKARTEIAAAADEWDLALDLMVKEEEELMHQEARRIAGLNDVAQAQAKVRAEVTKTSAVARDLGMTFETLFEDAIIGGQKFSDVLRGLGQDIARIFVRRQLTEPLVNAASAFFSGFKLPGFANGGITPGGPIIVGERGPEIVSPPAGSRISPMSGGGDIYQSFDFSGANPATVMMLRQEAGRIKNDTINAMRNMKSRGYLPEFS